MIKCSKRQIKVWTVVWSIEWSQELLTRQLIRRSFTIQIYRKFLLIWKVHILLQSICALQCGTLSRYICISGSWIPSSASGRFRWRRRLHICLFEAWNKTKKNYQGGIHKLEALNDKRMYETGNETCPMKMLKFFLSITDPKASHLFNKCVKDAIS